MQVRDESLWHELQKELQDVEDGKNFLSFISAWCDRAEEVLSQDSYVHPSESLRMTLGATEEECAETKNIWIVGQALVVACMHWVHGDAVSEGLTEIELRLVQDITAAKIAQLQEEAEAVPTPEE